MEHVRDSTKNLQLLSELLLTYPVLRRILLPGSRQSIESYPGGTGDLHFRV